MDKRDKVSAREAALSLLDRRMYTVSEMVKKLFDKGYTSEETAEAVEDLIEIGFLDDRKYSELFIESQLAKGRGSRRIQADLWRKGVDKDVLADAFAGKEAEIGGDLHGFESDAAMKTALKIFKPTEDRQENEKMLAKIGRRLATCGYSPDIVFDVLGKLRRKIKDDD